VGGFDPGLLGSGEPMVKYHPVDSGNLTHARQPGGEQCLVGSLTGAVASKKVTEAREGSLRLIGNQP
jgi:hypothetical protein